jgi:hypothetical protein
MKVKQLLLGIIAAAMVIGGSVAGATPALAASDAAQATMAQTAVAQTAVANAAMAQTAMAPAATPAGPDVAQFHRFRNVHTGRCIDDSDIGLRSFSCNGGVFQLWDMDFTGPAGAGWWSIRSHATGACLQDLDSGLFGGACDGGIRESWKFFDNNGNTVIQNVDTGRCLDDSVGPGLRSFPCNGLNFQDWVLLPG